MNTHKNLQKTSYIEVEEASAAIENPNVELCKFAEVAGFASLQERLLIPDQVFSALPAPLKQCTSYFDNKYQKDLFLTGALGVISGCFNNVFGNYHNDKCNPNLYSFISAPAGNGKGALNYARVLANPYHKLLREENKQSKKGLFIPGNVSAAALMSHLSEGKGKGIFFESEADTLSNTFKQDWGNFSDLLRKAFHHEQVSLSRKGQNELIEIDKPQLSIVLSGTPNQIKRLIPDAEDGLFSRFIFYCFDNEPEWEDVRPNPNKGNATDFFEKQAEGFLTIINHVNSFEKIEFKLIDEHFDVLNQHQEYYQNEAIKLYGNGISSVTKRQGLIWFKMAMILTILRNHNALNENNIELVCSEEDFETSMLLCETYMRHSFHLYDKMSSTKVKNLGDEREEKMLALLPDGEFDNNTFITLGKEQLDLQQRAIYYLFSKLKAKGLIKNVRHGYSIKTQALIKTM